MKHKLQDLIDLEHFQNMLKQLNGIYSFPSRITDNVGNVLIDTAYQDICTRFHRMNKSREGLCMGCDQSILNHTFKVNPGESTRCPDGLTDLAIPIIIDGIRYGSFASGPFFLEEPDMELFRARSKTYGFEEEAYLEAVRKVPVRTREQLNRYLSFINELIALITENGLNKLQEKSIRKQTEKSREILDAHMQRNPFDPYEALINSEQKWRNVLATTPQIGISLSPEAEILFANPHFLKLTGWDIQEVIGRNWFDMFIPPAIREAVGEVFSKLILEKDPAGFSTYENVILDRHGAIINVSWSNVVTRDAHGKVVDVTCLGVDLTERQRAEKALQKSEAYMGSVFRAVPTGVGVVHDRIFSQVNDKLCDMLGYAKEELIGQSSIMIYPSVDEFNTVGREKYLQIREKGTGTVETVMKRKNGETINVLLSSTPIEIDDLSAGVTFTALDITARKKAEKELLDSHERFLTVLDSIDATINVVDMETHEILFMNRYMIDSFGGDLTGEICWSAFRGESKPCLHCTIDNLVDENNVPTGVIVWQGNNPISGKWYINHDRAIKWTNGRPVRLQVSTDITDLLKMEEQLRQAHKMESVGRLAGGVAHDFNNMLSIILGNTEMLLKELDTANPAIHKLHEIHKAAERSTNLTRQLLAFARKQTISPRSINLNETIERMLKMLRRLIGENITLAWLPKGNLWMTHIDPSQVDQILANLCVNARDAIKDIGNVIIKSDNVSFDHDFCHTNSGFKPGDHVMISLSDDGCGMEKEILDNLFEPFFTTKKAGEGTGLGLATVYGIVEQNNGFIKVQSEPGTGTTFSIYFPRHHEEELPVEKAESNLADLTGKETILLVEDEESILEIMSQMLERLGYTVLSAATPEAAMEIGTSCPGKIDLIMTDIVMPGMNGRDLATKMSKQFQHLKCLFMSGYPDNVIANHGVLNSGTRFIQKPFSMEALALKVREVLDEGDISVNE